MLTKRIIPCLDVKDGRVVKGVNFVSLRDAGDPVECAKTYNASGADELVFLDITATIESRGTTVEMARSVANEVFIPFTIILPRTPSGFLVWLMKFLYKPICYLLLFISRKTKPCEKRTQNCTGEHPYASCSVCFQHNSDYRDEYACYASQSQ